MLHRQLLLIGLSLLILTPVQAADLSGFVHWRDADLKAFAKKLAPKMNPQKLGFRTTGQARESLPHGGLPGRQRGVARDPAQSREQQKQALELWPPKIEKAVATDSFGAPDVFAQLVDVAPFVAAEAVVYLEDGEAF